MSKSVINNGGDKPKRVPATPQGYSQLSMQQRQDWNNFLGYLRSQGVAGSVDLDRRDKAMGYALLDQYKKDNPEFGITKEMIPFIQYEQFNLRKGDSFSDLTPEELVTLRGMLPKAYIDREISDVDGWIGSRTSMQPYPTGRGGDNKGGSWDYGVNVEDFVRAQKDHTIRDKYKTPK